MKLELEPAVLGVNPLVGVDHYLTERVRDRALALDENRILRVMRTSFEMGARAVTFTPSPQLTGILTRMAEESPPREQIGIYPLLPNLGEYWPAYMSGGAPGFLRAILKDLSFSGKAKAVLRGGATWLTQDPIRAMRVYVGVEIEKLQRGLPSWAPIRSVLLSETFTDAILSFGLVDVLRAFGEICTEDLGIVPGLQTRNFARLVSFLDTEGLPIRDWLLMAPFNPIGFQMTPSRLDCERTLTRYGALNVMAISVMAGGQISVESALSYLRKLGVIRSAAVGVSTESHARETFPLLARLT
jgi:hypothetical protein